MVVYVNIVVTLMLCMCHHCCDIDGMHMSTFLRVVILMVCVCVNIVVTLMICMCQHCYDTDYMYVSTLW